MTVPFPFLPISLPMIISASILSATIAAAQTGSSGEAEPATDDQAIDISGELVTTPQALLFALSEERVPNADTVKIERIKAQFSPKGKRWEFLFRDEDKTYQATVQQDRYFDLDKKFDEDGENPEFWASLPAPQDVELPEVYFEKAIEIVEGFNPGYTAIHRAIVEYEVCDPPKMGDQSDHKNGCRTNEDKEDWEVFIQISGVIRGEKDTFFKVINFDEGLPSLLNNASVSGSW
ncbi:MAG: hypothetical protein ACK5M4_15555 [Pseudorhodobacter sp.]